MTIYFEEIFGADPAKVQWDVVRGNTSIFRVEFLEDDEVTAYDMTGWDIQATAYDPVADVLDALEVETGSGYVEITATPEVSANWGDKYASIVAELQFDIKVTIDNTKVWTPVVGTIRVIGDVTGGGL